MAISIGERIGKHSEIRNRIMDQVMASIRVACPGTIKSFNVEKQTVSVQLNLKERVWLNNKFNHVTIPVIEDLPIKIPRGGGFAVTIPVAVGDECLVVFGDSCIDGWWQSGGVQKQMDRRRHDLSDGFAILGVTSVPNAIPQANYSTNSARLTKIDGSVYVEVAAQQVNEVNNKSNGTINHTCTGSTGQINHTCTGANGLISHLCSGANGIINHVTSGSGGQINIGSSGSAGQVNINCNATNGVLNLTSKNINTYGIFSQFAGHEAPTVGEQFIHPDWGKQHSLITTEEED